MTTTNHPTRPLDLDERNALRYSDGVPGALPPAARLMEALERWGLVEITDPSAWAIHDRYSPTSLGRATVALIGERG